MATTYDPQVLSKLADSLYAQARTIVTVSSFLGLVLGAAGGFYAGGAAGLEPTLVVALGAVLGLAIGYFGAQSRAFALRAQAQSILCQRQIEENTRQALDAVRRVA